MTNCTGMLAINTQTSANQVHGSRPWRRRNSIEAARTTMPSAVPAAQLAIRFVPAGSGDHARADSLEPLTGRQPGPCTLGWDAGKVTLFSHGEQELCAIAERCAADCCVPLLCDGTVLPVAYGGDG